MFHSIDLLFWGLVAICVIGVILLLVIAHYQSVEEAAKWEKFAEENECRIVEEVQETAEVGVGYGMTTSGQFGVGTVITVRPKMVCWECKDGKRYWREG